ESKTARSQCRWGSVHPCPFKTSCSQMTVLLFGLALLPKIPISQYDDFPFSGVCVCVCECVCVCVCVCVCAHVCARNREQCVFVLICTYELLCVVRDTHMLCERSLT